MFDRSTGKFREKDETAVRLAFNNGEKIDAIMFHVMGERLSDLLNDPRSFVPIRLENGETRMVAKSQIASVQELLQHTDHHDAQDTGDEQPGEDTRNDQQADVNSPPRKPSRPDPFEVLGIERTKDLGTIRAAYKKRMKEVHPDSIAAQGLSEPQAKAAHVEAQQVNQAYKLIMDILTRKAEKASDS